LMDTDTLLDEMLLSACGIKSFNTFLVKSPSVAASLNFNFTVIILDTFRIRHLFPLN